MLVLNRQEYLKVVHKVRQTEIFKKVEFIEGIPFFSKMNHTQKYQLLQDFGEETFIMNQVVIQQSQKVDKVFIVVSGEYEILRNKKASIKIKDPTNSQ